MNTNLCRSDQIRKKIRSIAQDTLDKNILGANPIGSKPVIGHTKTEYWVTTPASRYSGPPWSSTENEAELHINISRSNPQSKSLQDEVDDIIDEMDALMAKVFAEQVFAEIVGREIEMDVEPNSRTARATVIYKFEYFSEQAKGA